MKNKFYMQEFEHFNGESFIKFNIVDIGKGTITLAITNQGKITLGTYNLYEDENGLYFEYGHWDDIIYLKDFDEGVDEYVQK